jgi:ankyrin repeat protein
MDIAANDGLAALHLAAAARNPAACLLLVNRGAMLDVPIMRGYERLPFMCGGSTPLHIASAQGDLEVRARSVFFFFFLLLLS